MSHHNPISLLFDELDPIHTQKSIKNTDLAAAVLIAITNDNYEPEIIFTRRADHLNSHSGQVSFPGGRWEFDDRNLADTALRESHEEIGLQPSLVELKGCLECLPSINGLDVQPYVGLVPNKVSLLANPDEIADIFSVPIRFLIEGPTRVDHINRAGMKRRVPAWEYKGFDIWGLTAVFTYRLLNRMGFNINLNDVKNLSGAKNLDDTGRTE